MSSSSPTAPSSASPPTPVSPFADLKLHPLTSLHSAPPRSPCPSCTRSRRYWCGDCEYLFVPPPPLPPLPLQVIILQSASESPSRSTAQHLPLLAPSSATLRRPFPACAPSLNPVLSALHGTVALLYPSAGALAPTAAAETLPNLTTVIVIDAPWAKSIGMAANSCLASLPRVKLADVEPGLERATHFWRYSPIKGDGSPMFSPENVKGLLSTVEAVHQFVTEFGAAKGAGAVGDWDNLMWLFAWNYGLVKEVYERTPGKRERIMRKSKGRLKEF